MKKEYIRPEAEKINFQAEEIMTDIDVKYESVIWPPLNPQAGNYEGLKLYKNEKDEERMLAESLSAFPNEIGMDFVTW